MANSSMRKYIYDKNTNDLGQSTGPHMLGRKGNVTVDFETLHGEIDKRNIHMHR